LTNKFGFIEGALPPRPPPKNFLKKVLWNLKNFKKGLFNNTFLKVLGVKPLFQKGLAGSRGWPLALPAKPEFKILLQPKEREALASPSEYAVILLGTRS
jgi:hypothetical protein